MNKNLLKSIITIVGVFIIGFGIHSYIHYEGRMAYDVISNEQQIDIGVKHIAKEKGKEPIYTLSCFYDSSLKIPESIYKEFIGDENNTITIHEEELTFYVADAWFGFGFDDALNYSLCRYSYPWEEPAKPFSIEEIKEAAEVFIDKPGEFNLSDLSFEADYTNRGHTSTNPLDRGAKMISTVFEVESR